MAEYEEIAFWLLVILIVIGPKEQNKGKFSLLANVLEVSIEEFYTNKFALSLCDRQLTKVAKPTLYAYSPYRSILFGLSILCLKIYKKW